MLRKIVTATTDEQTKGRADMPPPLKDVPVENFRKIRVIVIGAGFSGIYLAIRIPEWLRNVDLTIYEKNDGVGGTWCALPRCVMDD